ncbi:MAG: hypothetical protein R3272_13065 [Candidatus Promineifilaceae bacterium]|nr:hypothetical protein [Candidatus Promineifilaceae bacterium]
MNPFTRFLRQWLGDDDDVDALVGHWDALEALIIRVYKQGEATPADEAEYQALRRWMQANYGTWAGELRPLWQETEVAGAPAEHDPFLRLTTPRAAADYVGDWNAMQHLPAAREALNRLVLSRSGQE